MTGRYIEEEMNRFEAEIHRQPMNSFGPPRMFLPPQMRSFHSPMGHPGVGRPPNPGHMMHRFPGGSTMSAPAVISAPPRSTTPAVISAPPSVSKDDDDDDIMATLMKYEAQVKKDTKKPSSGLVPSKVSTTTVVRKATPMAEVAKKSTPMAEAAKKSTVTATTVAAKSQQAPLKAPPPPPPSASASSSAAPPNSNDPPAKKPKKPKRIIRTGGGQVWEDETLKEWDNNDFRIFCGDLGNDVTDEVLARTFGRFPSFQRAKVVRDRRTNKTKGFGFVSFTDPADFTRAMKELNGKYVGSRPIKLRKSNWKDRNIEIVRQKQKLKQQMGYKW